MKKISSFIGIVLLSTFCLAGCGRTIPYKPKVDEIYYNYYGNYRIIELVSNEPEIINDFPVNDHSRLKDPSIGTVFVDITDQIAPNSVIFTSDVDIDGAYKILNILHCNIDNLLDQLNQCGSLPLYEIYKRIPVNPPYTHELNLSGKGEGYVYGEVATVKAYTFNYVDRSIKDGKQIGKGELNVFICGPTVFKEFYLPGYGEK